MTISNDLWVIDFDFQSIDQLVQHLDQDLYQQVHPVSQVSPVTIICHEDGGVISAYRHCVTNDEWTQSYIGNSHYVLTGTIEPENCSSYDDVSPIDQDFDSESELLSFFGRGLHQLDEPGTWTCWSKCQGPHCELPEFWEFHGVQMRRSYTPWRDTQSLWNILVRPIYYFWWMVLRCFQEDEWGTRPITTHKWWFDGFYQTRVLSWGGGLEPLETLNDYLRRYSESRYI